MSKQKVYVVNAFTADGLNGNPAGVVLDSHKLTDDQMLRMAQELNVSETAFTSDSTVATKKVRFFTPTNEVDLCGHATIATWSLLHSIGKVGMGTFTQQTKAGVLDIDIQNDITFMEQTPVSFFKKVAISEIAFLLGLEATDFSELLQPQIVSTGLKDLLVPVAEKSVLARLQPKLSEIAEFSWRHDISGFHVFALLNTADSIAAARNFAPADGIPEECATGTSNGALLCYLKHNNALPDQEIYRIEQGEAMGQLSHIYGKFINDVVWIGGRATIIETRTL